MAVYIIIFGAGVRADGTPSGTLQRRVDGAMMAAKSHADSYFIPTGGMGANGYVEAEVMQDMLMAAGVAAHRIIIEDQARDTLESVRLCDAVLRRANDVAHVEPCTSRYHQPRCALLLRLQGWRVQVPEMPQDYGRLPVGMLVRYILKEIIATPYDAALLIFGRVFNSLYRR